MKVAIKEKWLAGLRSGEYEQGKGALREEADPNKFCAMGVLYNEVSPHTWHQTEDGYWNNRDAWEALTSWDFNLPSQIVQMNDREGKSFDEIAKWVDEHVPEDWS